jgi:hypothetical protein
MWWVDESNLGGADQGNDVGQRSQKNREAATKFDVFDTLVTCVSFRLGVCMIVNLQVRASCPHPT